MVKPPRPVQIEQEEVKKKFFVERTVEDTMRTNRTKATVIMATIILITVLTAACKPAPLPPPTLEQATATCGIAGLASYDPKTGAFTCQQPAAPADPTAPPVDDGGNGGDPQGNPDGQVGSLNYDESNADPLTSGQTRLIALYLRDAEAAGTTQAAMEAAIVAIQQEAAASNATVMQGSTLTLPQRVAWLVWCSNAQSVDYPADISDVFDLLPQGPGRVWIQVPFAEGVPLRSKDTFSGCTGGDFWAVRVH